MSEQKTSKFEKCMRLLNGAFPKFYLEEGRMKTYNYFLKGYDEDVLLKVTMDYIKEEDEAPTIHKMIARLETELMQLRIKKQHEELEKNRVLERGMYERDMRKL